MTGPFLKRAAIGLVGTLLVGIAGADAPRKGGPPAGTQPEQVVIEAMVAKAGVLVGTPTALAKVGPEGNIRWFPQPDPYGPGPLALRFQSTPTSGERYAVRVSAVVDEQIVATREVVIGRTEGSELNFDAGGYSWNLRINYFSPSLMQARRLERQKFAPLPRARSKPSK
jgi:hypothetical protein